MQTPNEGYWLKLVATDHAVTNLRQDPSPTPLLLDSGYDTFDLPIEVLEYLEQHPIAVGQSAIFLAQAEFLPAFRGILEALVESGLLAQAVVEKDLAAIELLITEKRLLLWVPSVIRESIRRTSKVR